MPEGVKGWGVKGILDLSVIEELGDDTDNKFLGLWSGVTFQCDDGVLHVGDAIVPDPDH